MSRAAHSETVDGVPDTPKEVRDTRRFAGSLGPTDQMDPDTGE